MKKQRTFILLTMLVVIGRAFDVTTTYLYTPDLQRETNVVVKLFDAGWLPIIALQLTLVAVIIFCLHFYLFRFKPKYPEERNLSIKQFSSYLFFGNIESFNKLFYRVPKNKSSLIASIGYIATMTLIAVSFVVGTSTTLLLISEKYQQLYRNGIQLLLFIFIAISATWFTIRFFSIEHQKFKEGSIISD